MSQCPYFTTSGGGYCKKAGTSQTAAQIQQYCVTDSNWQSCANYTGSSCFLTTACVHHAGLSDDCAELTGMRKFRDEYLLSLPNGREMYDDYYRSAPVIVDAIGHSEERTAILTDILAKVRQCVHSYKNGDSKTALDIYTSMFNELKTKMIPFQNEGLAPK